MVNAVLALTIQSIAPPQPQQSDREKYEYAGAHPLEPDCPRPWVLYCYRVLVPATLEMIPAAAEARWRAYRWAATTVAGTVTALTAATIAAAPRAAFVAAILVQSSYGFAFTGLDPYSADPAVFALLAVLAWCWARNRWLLAGLLGVVGIFAKETVVLMSAATALAALLPARRHGWRGWVAQAAFVLAVLIAYRWVMQSVWRWSAGESASLLQRDLIQGGWLSLWIEGNTPAAMAFLLFATFGFSWWFALIGFRDAPTEIRHLAIGSGLPFLALNYVQNPERALGNLFFVVIPLAAAALSRGPAAVAFAAAVLNALITARAGTASEWLPRTTYLVLPALIAAGAAAWYAVRRPNRHMG